MRKQTTHPSEEKLSAYNRGLLSLDESVAIETHISNCEPCCETIVSLSSDDTFVGLLKAARQLPAEQIPDHDCMVAKQSSIHGDIPPELAEHPRYEIVRLIGKGGMGDVYEAVHRKMERRVALKVINRDLFQKAEAVNRFHREVKAAAQLSHSNIVTAFDADQADAFHFMVMEFVDGVDLAQIVKDHGAMPVGDACDYIRQAAMGLQHAHERGMVHRDIKPHNLMVTADGTIKILDFGLASLTPEALPNSSFNEARSDLTAAGAIMGTPDFISPEQANDARQVDIRSDIYSLGATLYYLLSGQVPFDDGSVMHKLKSHAEVEPVALTSLRDDLPGELVGIVTRMMAKAPNERYLTPREVAEALESFLQTWQPDEKESQGQGPSSGGNMSGTRGQKSEAGDASPNWLSVLANWLFYISLVPIAIFTLDTLLSSDETSVAAADRVLYYMLASVVISSIAGVLSGVNQFKTSDRKDHRINRLTTEQSLIIAAILVGSAVYYFTQTGAGVVHIEMTQPGDELTIGTHPLKIVDTSGNKPLGGTSGTRQDDAAGITTHFFKSANGRYNIELTNQVLMVNGKEYSLEGPNDSIRIVDDQVEITRVVSGVSSGPFKVDGKTGVATGHALGIDFVVAGATGVQTRNQVAAGKPKNSSASLEITLADDAIIRLEMLEAGGPISFHLNGSDIGSLKAGDKVAIDEQRKVTVNGISRSDQVAIQGEWRVIFAEDSGRPGPPEALRDIRMVITQDTLSMEVGGQKNVSTYRLVPSTSPKSIDLTTGGRTKPGIYDLQGDTLRICISEDRDERPTAFDSQPDSVNDLVLTLKRVKPDNSSPAESDVQSHNGPLSEELAHSLIPQAASISNEDFQKLQTKPSAESIENKSLSLVLLNLDVRNQSPDAASDFRFLIEGYPKPSEIAAAMSISRSKGYFSIIQPDYITECKITKSTDEIAQGKVTFNAPKFYIGSVTFEARKHEGTWRIEKFHLPASQISIVLGEDGNWQHEVKDQSRDEQTKSTDWDNFELPKQAISQGTTLLIWIDVRSITREKIDQSISSLLDAAPSVKKEQAKKMFDKNLQQTLPGFAALEKGIEAGIEILLMGEQSNPADAVAKEVQDALDFVADALAAFESGLDVGTFDATTAEPTESKPGQLFVRMRPGASAKDAIAIMVQTFLTEAQVDAEIEKAIEAVKAIEFVEIGGGWFAASGESMLPLPSREQALDTSGFARTLGKHKDAAIRLAWQMDEKTRAEFDQAQLDAGVLAFGSLMTSLREMQSTSVGIQVGRRPKINLDMEFANLEDAQLFKATFDKLLSFFGLQIMFGSGESDVPEEAQNMQTTRAALSLLFLNRDGARLSKEFDVALLERLTSAGLPWTNLFEPDQWVEPEDSDVLPESKADIIKPSADGELPQYRR